MNREQRRKEQKLKGKSGFQNAYLEKAKEVNKAYSECTDEILNIYNQWVGVSFKSEKEFLDIIDDNDLTICVSENESAIMCWFEIIMGRERWEKLLFLNRQKKKMLKILKQIWL